MTEKLSSQQQIALVSLLKTCAKQSDLQNGHSVHANIMREGLLLTNIFMGSAVIHMYIECGDLARGQQVFDELPLRNVISWNALITGYSHFGYSNQVLYCLKGMKEDGLFPNAVTFLCVLKACGSLQAAGLGICMHAEIMRQGLLGSEIALGNALVDMYAKCGVLVKAQEVFDGLPRQNVITWNTLIGGYAQHGHGDEALAKFIQMQKDGLLPDGVSFLGVLKACGTIGSVKDGIYIHADIVRRALLEKNQLLGNALVDMYAKCGAISMAEEVFEKLPARNVVSWNALLTGYCQCGYPVKTLIHFKQMQKNGLSPNATTFACILQACGDSGDVIKGKAVHEEILKQRLLEKDSVLCTALVDMYIRFGDLCKAQNVFDEFCVNDVVSWTALISGYCQHGHGEEALKCFQEMKRKGFCPDGVTFPCILKACTKLGAAEKGEEVYTEIVSEGFCGKSKDLPSIWSALVDMYAKCGALSKAQEVFNKLPVQDVVSWTALIAGYARSGKHDIVLKLFNEMQKDGVEPNSITFSIVLNSCSYLGLVNEASDCFKVMQTKYHIIPTFEHYTCMVYLLGHAGHFDKAMKIIEGMPSSDYLHLWFALLAACKKWGNVKLARLAFDHVVHIDKDFVEAYSFMCNIYTKAGMQREAMRVRRMRLKIKDRKKV
ncbi:hypothetical protein KP509_04G072400 [Ceratopteris richardii]|uniref:Pentatricopeptide repeat-containing protein n=1 Tax=Ceratopteris richardii TaxID=49495 RepID=A0A8T2UY95_CERRI|nr:hypothetical protein KP509_04G072400 [Ceratopteris richardii]